MFEEKFLIYEGAKLQDALTQLNETSGLGLILVRKDKLLLGTVTDGDIRRSFLNGFSLESDLTQIMCSTPTYFKDGTQTSILHDEATKKLINIIPLVDDNKKVVDLFILQKEFNGIPVVLMAGGRGKRLGPLTNECPKPMLSIGKKPLLERIIERFLSQGFSDFFISVNYKANIIENHFRDGSNFNCNVSYLREEKPLGTAGSLKLTPKETSGPLIVMNGDLLTSIDFNQLVNFHNKNNSRITMCIKEYDLQVPYGVINQKDGIAISFDEKPVQHFFVNAGVYVIDSSLFKFIPEDKYFDMSAFLNRLIQENIRPRCFPVLEKWIDIGKADDLNIARQTYKEE